MLGSNFVKFLMPVWNEKSIPLQILHASSVSWKIIPLYFFSSNNLYFGQKELLKVKIFETFECLGQILSNSLCQFETKSRFLSKFCMPLQFHERLFLCTFLAQTIYTLVKRSSLKWKFLRLSSAWVKFCQIPYASLKRKVDSSPNFACLFSFMKDYSSVLF